MALRALPALLLLLSSLSLHAGCSLGKGDATVVLLLPLSGEGGVVGQSLLDGFIEASLDGNGDLDLPCEVDLHYLDSEDEATPFADQWERALQLGPDLLLGPLLQQNREQLASLGPVVLPKGTVWLYPGFRDDVDALPAGSTPPSHTFSLGLWEQARSLLEFGWDQGEHDLLLLFPDSEQGHLLSGRVAEAWGQRGGVVAAAAHYGARFSGLDLALRGLLATSRGDYDFLLVLADDARLRMVRPLMNYHGESKPIYSLNAPLGIWSEKGKDLDGLFFPLQPVLAERAEGYFGVDDILLQVESVGFDLMRLLQLGGIDYLQEKGSFPGRSGRYYLERGRLSRMLCIAGRERGGELVVECP